jgi:hypothetical protein
MMFTKPGKNVLSPRVALQFEQPLPKTARWRPHPGFAQKEMLTWQQLN